MVIDDENTTFLIHSFKGNNDLYTAQSCSKSTCYRGHLGEGWFFSLDNEIFSLDSWGFACKPIPGTEPGIKHRDWWSSRHKVLVNTNVERSGLNDLINDIGVERNGAEKRPGSDGDIPAAIGFPSVSDNTIYMPARVL